MKAKNAFYISYCRRIIHHNDCFKPCALKSPISLCAVCFQFTNQPELRLCRKRPKCNWVARVQCNLNKGNRGTKLRRHVAFKVVASERSQWIPNQSIVRNRTSLAASAGQTFFCSADPESGKAISVCGTSSSWGSTPFPPFPAFPLGQTICKFYHRITGYCSQPIEGISWEKSTERLNQIRRKCSIF